MLRIKKVQPMFLSGVVRTKLNRREHWVELAKHLRTDVLFGIDEDFWDKLTGARDESSWAHEIRDTVGELKRKTNQVDIKNSKLARSMWDVVLRERALAAQEERERSSEK